MWEVERDSVVSDAHVCVIYPIYPGLRTTMRITIFFRSSNFELEQKVIVSFVIDPKWSGKMQIIESSLPETENIKNWL